MKVHILLKEVFESLEIIGVYASEKSANSAEYDYRMRTGENNTWTEEFEVES